jgi:hypothetical protein
MLILKERLDHLENENTSLRQHINQKPISNSAMDSTGCNGLEGPALLPNIPSEEEVRRDLTAEGMDLSNVEKVHQEDLSIEELVYDFTVCNVIFDISTFKLLISQG